MSGMGQAETDLQRERLQVMAYLALCQLRELGSDEPEEQMRARRLLHRRLYPAPESDPSGGRAVGVARRLRRRLRTVATSSPSLEGH